MSTDNPSDGQDRTAELLSQALHEEAGMVDTDPAALQSIQQRTRPARSARRHRWAFGALGAATATAAIITAAVLIGDSGSPSSGPGPANAPTKGTVSQQVPVELSVPVTYVSRPGADRTARLYTEQHTVSSTGNAAIAAVRELLTGKPADPDYTSGWPQTIDVDGGIATADDYIQVDLTGPAGGYAAFDPSSSSTPEDGALAVQALLRTAGGQVGDQGVITYNGEPMHSVFGVELPTTVKPDDEVRALISIDNIVDGQTVSSPVMVKVSGNVFEGNVNWQLLNSDGVKVDDGYVTTSMGSWTQTDIDLGQLTPGAYTLRCFEVSPEDGKPGNVDDKTFTVS